MTLSAAYKKISSELEKRSIDDSALEARLIFQKVLDITYSEFLFRGNDEISEEKLSIISEMIGRRIDGEPIQYILGEWDFMNCTFKVGDGVLIPRPETEILCEYVIEKIKEVPSPTVYDLCAGSGCIGISVKKALPDSDVYLVEKSDKALSYLRCNAETLCSENMPVIIHGDILNVDDFSTLPLADVIISNPPYIKSSDIPDLQSEVLKEPAMALDGGEDGLIFYRALVYEWSQRLKDGGFMAFECGEDQAQDICQMFHKIGFDSEIINDYNNIQRIVIGRRHPQ